MQRRVHTSRNTCNAACFPPEPSARRLGGIVLVIFRRYKENWYRYIVAIAGMFMPFSATDLLAELPRLRRYARILTDDPEHADRLVEETLFRFREQQRDSGSDAARRTQLLALLRSVSADHTAPGARRETAATPITGRSNSKADPTGSAERSVPDRGTEMLAQLRALPLEQREVLVLVAVEQMSYPDIAALLHLPVATVISRLSQAREVLRSSPPKPVSAPNSAK